MFGIENKLYSNFVNNLFDVYWDCNFIHLKNPTFTGGNRLDVREKVANYIYSASTADFGVITLHLNGLETEFTRQR